MEQPLIAILGGSGLYAMDALENPHEEVIETPWGMPSAPLVVGRLDGIKVVFLARHGLGHRLLPSEVPYKANIFALKKLGVRHILSVSAVGSLQEGFRPKDVVIPDQYIDLTKQRDVTFFGQGLVAHVSMAEPVCARLSSLVAKAAASCSGQENPAYADVRVHCGGTYVCIEGPHFSSKAESLWFRSMGADIIGMTNMPEAKLAKEAQMAYASLAMVTDYDCWHTREAAVTAESAVAVLQHNVVLAQQIIRKVVQLVDKEKPVSASHHALEQALFTPQSAMNETQKELVKILKR